MGDECHIDYVCDQCRALHHWRAEAKRLAAALEEIAELDDVRSDEAAGVAGRALKIKSEMNLGATMRRDHLRTMARMQKGRALIVSPEAVEKWDTTGPFPVVTTEARTTGCAGYRTTHVWIDEIVDIDAITKALPADPARET